jgi:hypothetical protein
LLAEASEEGQSPCRACRVDDDDDDEWEATMNNSCFLFNDDVQLR